MKSFKKLFLLGTVSISIFGVVGCGNDSIQNAESDTKDNAKQVTKTDAQKNDELKDKVKADADKVAKAKEEKAEKDYQEGVEYNRIIDKKENHNAPKISIEDYDKMKRGMSLDEVREIAEPHEFERYTSHVEIKYVGLDGISSAMIMFDENDKLKSKAQIELPSSKKGTSASVTDSESTHSSVDDSSNKEEKNDRMPWYKDVNNDSASVDYSHYEKIKVGMSANQVKEAIGKPRMIEKYKTYSVYGYLGDREEGSLRVIFDPNGTVTKVEQDNLPKYERMHGDYDDTLPNGGRDID
ncbi:hypothetical protein ABEZ57_05355 [Bacillus mycoides]